MNNTKVGGSSPSPAKPSHYLLRPGFQSDPLEAVDRVPQNLQQSFRLACYLHFPHDPARVIYNADAGLLDRYVQSSKMVHAALLLLMLEAITTDLVSPSA